MIKKEYIKPELTEYEIKLESVFLNPASGIPIYGGDSDGDGDEDDEDLIDENL